MYMVGGVPSRSSETITLLIGYNPIKNYSFFLKKWSSSPSSPPSLASLVYVTLPFSPHSTYKNLNVLILIFCSLVLSIPGMKTLREQEPGHFVTCYLSAVSSLVLNKCHWHIRA